MTASTMARVWSGFAGISMLILLAVYAATASRLTAINDAGRTAVLAVSGVSPATPTFDARIADTRIAVAYDPMNQRLVNTAMLAMSRGRPGPPDSTWFAMLARLGWRDTPSRQNLLIRHVQQGEIVATLDDIDGLLRRDQLIDQISPVLLTAESDPVWRIQIIERLRQRPSWRFGYLQRGSLIDDPVLLAARADTIRTLQRLGDDVAVGEIAPILPRLLAADLGAQAFAIWQAREPSIARPVADPGFAGLALERQPSTVPFHWQLTNGSDYGVDVESRPAPHLTLSWNGAGAPIFATQHISESAGHYAVIFTTLEPGSGLSDMIGVRAVCGSEIIDFVHSRQLSPTRIAYAGERAVPCSYPRLELFGRSARSGPRDRRVAISHVAIANVAKGSSI